jgi:ATP-dependent protease ClpP protease subunit
VKTARIVIDKNIGLHPTSEELAKGEEMTFEANDLLAFIEANSDATTIEVLLNTNGGSVSQGMDIYNILLAEKSKGKTIKTIAFKANSIGSVILAAGDVREVYSKSEVMIHNPFLPIDSLGIDNLTSDVLQELADDISTAENLILAIYKEALNLDENDFSEVKSLMKAETDLKGEGALKYGFATHLVKNIISDTRVKKTYAYTDKIAALIKTKNNNNMSDNKEVNSKLDAIASKLKNLFKAQNLTEDGEPMKVKNSTATAKDGSVMYFTEEALVAGIAVFSDEAMTTPIPDGIYEVEENEVYVTGGLVEKIELAGEDMKKKMAALENENSTLKTELENLKAENLAVKNQATETVNQLKELNTEFQNLKKIIPNDVKNLSTKNNSELSPAQKQSLKRKEMMNLGK